MRRARRKPETGDLKPEIGVGRRITWYTWTGTEFSRKEARKGARRGLRHETAGRLEARLGEDHGLHGGRGWIDERAEDEGPGV